MPSDLEQAFLAYHEAHPTVYARFEALALEAARAGRERFSARVIFGRIRWDQALDADDGSGFKLNDHYSPYYARLFMRDHPEFGEFFETRKVRAEAEPCWDAERGELFGRVS